MTNKIKIGLLSCVLILSMISSTFAAEYPLYLGDGTVDYQNTLTENIAGKNITFSVIGVDKQWGASEWLAPTDEIVYAEEGIVGIDGTYGFIFRVKESGVYSVISSVDGESKNIKDKFEVILSEKTLESAEKLKDATNVSEVKAILDEYKYDLGVTSEISDGLCEILLNSKEDLSIAEAEKTVDVCKKGVITEKLNQNKIKTIAGLEDTAGIEGSTFEKWYKSDFDSDIVKRLSGKKFKSVSQYERALQEAVLLERIENPDGSKDIINIVSENYLVMGLSTDELSLTKAAKLAGGDYSTYQSFKKAFEAKENAGSSSGGGSSSGRGGSSGGGSFSGSSTGGSIGSDRVIFEEDLTVVENKVSRFNDMTGFEWAEAAVEALALKGIVNGKGDMKFAPADFVTREEFAKMIVTLFNFNVVPPTFDFIDVPEDSWYYGYVRKAYGSKVLQGISENVFGSGQNILRQDAIVMAYNALKYDESMPQGENEKVFNDENDISEYAKEAIDVLSATGIITGDDMGNVSPKSDITRAEAAMLVYNIMIKLNL